MQVDTEVLAVLLQIQQKDCDIAQAQRELHELPQRAAILEARTKRREIEQKREQLEELHEKSSERYAKFNDEDEELAEKQRKAQEEIDKSHSDYRDIEAHSKELNGYAKRRATLEEELMSATEELDRIEGLQAQVEKMLADLDAREAEATDSFVKEGGALKQKEAACQAERDKLAEEVPAELMATYEKTLMRCGGVALGFLKGNTCGVCRSGIEHGRLVDLKSGGNLVVCPNCGRLLIVEK